MRPRSVGGLGKTPRPAGGTGSDPGPVVRPGVESPGPGRGGFSQAG